MRDLIAIHTKVNPSSPGGSDWLRLIRTLITHPSACLSLIIYSGMAAEPIDPAVGQAPIIISQTGSAPIPPNASFELFVEAEGASPLTYQWLFNQEPISGADQSRRIFERFTPDQVGHYKVVVSNPHGSVTSDPMIMTLNPALIQEGVVIDWETPYESLAGSDASPVRAFHDGNGGGLTVGTAFWENRLKSRFLIAAYDQAGKQRWVALPEYSSTSLRSDTSPLRLGGRCWYLCRAASLERWSPSHRESLPILGSHFTFRGGTVARRLDRADPSPTSATPVVGHHSG